MPLKGALGHSRTITKHRHKVIANCARAGIFWQGRLGECSKYARTEVLAVAS